MIYFIACHGGPADHFATFAEELTRSGHTVEIYASGPALVKLKERGCTAIEFDAEDPSYAETLTTELAGKATVLFTDVGHRFDVSIHQALSQKAPRVLRLAYYDNPEASVPGDYGVIAQEVMRVANKTLFANSHLAKKPEIAVGLGYYPVSAAKELAKRRSETQTRLRAELFAKYQMEDSGQKVAVYFGGCNDVYFENAFPAFLNCLSDLSDTALILHQHPRAKVQNQDALQLQAWIKEHPNATVFLSTYTSDEAQCLADVALYYQTSMGPAFALAGIPTIQVGHIPYEDVLVRGGLALVATDGTSLKKALADAKPPEDERVVLQGLGLKENWPSILKEAVNFTQKAP